MKRDRLYIAILVLLMVGFVAIEYTKPKPIDWNDSYSAEDKIPYGCYVLFQQWKDLFSSEPIPISTTVYEQLEQFGGDSIRSNYIFINSDLPDQGEDIKALLRFVEKGNTVFIASKSYFGPLADTLNTSVDLKYHMDLDPVLDYPNQDSVTTGSKRRDSIGFTFTNPHLAHLPSYYFDRTSSFESYFDKVDSSHTVVLVNNSDSMPVLIKTSYGEGFFIFSSTPLAFSNYHLLKKEQANFAATALSYLPDQATYWDEYYKKYKREVNKSPFRFLFSKPPLKWGYWVLLISMVLFVLFEGKRTQRVIPIWKPLPNRSIEFAETLSRLYRRSNNHKLVALKKIQYFLEWIRATYYINEKLEDELFEARLHVKSGTSMEKCQQIKQLMLQIRQNNFTSERQLVALAKLCRSFQYPIDPS